MARPSWAPGVKDPLASDNLMEWQPLRSPMLPETVGNVGSGMPAEAKSRERQMATEKSDRAIVPMKPGNSGGGKGATLATSTRGHRPDPEPEPR